MNTGCVIISKLQAMFCLCALVFSLYACGDTTPLILSNGSPSGHLLADATSTVLSLTTNKRATCKYSTSPGPPYASMTNTLSTTGMTSHSTMVTGLSSGGSYMYYVRCQDVAGNVTTVDFPISFRVWPYPMDFGVYDALLFINKPDLKPYGLRPDWVVYTQNMWPPDTPDYNTPNEQYTRLAADTVWQAGHRGLVQLDLEVWPVDLRFHPQSKVDVGIANSRQIWKWFKDEAPGLNVGIYYYPPISDVRGTDPAKVTALQVANDYLARLTAQVDAMYPQSYMLNPDQQSWVDYTRLKIAEARRIGGMKPVYVYVWPQYHEMAGNLAHTYVDSNYWHLQLKTIKDAGADGIILWGGYQTQWDDSQGWWQATKEFMSTLHLTNR